jgi:site-specific DNA-methyltransferase (adenine-specific)
MKKEALVDLRDSILSVGLLQPPIGRHRGGQVEIIAGARRLSAIDMIAKDGVLFQCNGQIISPGEVPVLDIGELDPILLFEAELSENVIREPLQWADEMRAIAELHRMRKEVNPTQTVIATARELAARAHPDRVEDQQQQGNVATGAVSTYRRKIAQALTIDAHLDEPEIAKARNAKEAFQLVLKREHATYQAELLRRKGAVVSNIICDMRHGNMLTILPSLEAETFDLILTDPPYGVGASSAGHRARTVHHHNYEDTPENARLILKTLLIEGWRACKTRANMFIFNDIKNWDYFETLAKQMGWSPWPWPIIWQKSEHEGLTGGWGSLGFIRTYEMIFWATKGGRGLLRPELDVITEARVSRAQRIHGAEKPLGLLELLLTLTTMPGDWVLDPCAGSGSTLVAAKRLRRHSIGIELDKNIADEAYVRVNSTPEAAAPAKTKETTNGE